MSIKTSMEALRAVSKQQHIKSILIEIGTYADRVKAFAVMFKVLDKGKVTQLNHTTFVYEDQLIEFVPSYDFQKISEKKARDIGHYWYIDMREL